MSPGNTTGEKITYPRVSQRVGKGSAYGHRFHWNDGYCMWLNDQWFKPYTLGYCACGAYVTREVDDPRRRNTAPCDITNAEYACRFRDAAADRDSSAVALEAQLHDFLAESCSSVDFGGCSLDMWQQASANGYKLQTVIGEIDLLCVDRATGQLVIVELKRNLSPDAAVGQCLRYMGWVQSHLRPPEKVRGVIIARRHTPQLRYATSILDSLEVMTYKTVNSKSFELTRIID